jgi:aryl-alcohol dehydrogenase-like predicted oxidoreductase
MTTSRLGKDGPQISRVGLGTWAIGGSGWKYAWGPQDDADSIAVIHEAIDAGINWIDTAAVYGLGHSEEVVGRAVKGKRSQVLLATKCGRKPGPGGDILSVLDASSVREELEASLRRLSTDRIDLYQIHWPTPEPQIEEAWAEIARAVKAGKVRYAGVSNFDPSQMKRLQAIHPITSLQPPYSMLRRDIEAEILPFCAENAIGVICYSPLQMGLLTGAFSRERVAALAADDLRRRNEYFAEPALTRNLKLVERLRPIAERSGRTVGELALAWVLSRRGVTAVIVGGRRPGQARELAGAADWELSSQDLAEISQALAERDAAVSPGEAAP